MSSSNTKIPANKLIILYFVEKTGAAVSNSQITQFTLENGYMDYFNLQQAITELCNASYLTQKSHNQKKLYYISNQGVEVLGFFQHLIPDAVKKSVNNYLSVNKRKIQTEIDVSANYFPTEGGEYLIKCALIEGSGDMLMEISLVTADKEHAIRICNNWRSHTSSYYKEITEMLYKERQGD